MHDNVGKLSRFGERLWDRNPCGQSGCRRRGGVRGDQERREGFLMGTPYTFAVMPQ